MLFHSIVLHLTLLLLHRHTQNPTFYSENAIHSSVSLCIVWACILSCCAAEVAASSARSDCANGDIPGAKGSGGVRKEGIEAKEGKGEELRGRDVLEGWREEIPDGD